jgi:hypothetical protein
MPASRRPSSTKDRPKHRSSTKHRAVAAQPERRPIELTSLTNEWWSSWRRANALGWEYLDAMSGLVRLNMDAFSQVTRRR